MLLRDPHLKTFSGPQVETRAASKHLFRALEFAGHWRDRLLGSTERHQPGANAHCGSNGSSRSIWYRHESSHCDIKGFCSCTMLVWSLGLGQSSLSLSFSLSPAPDAQHARYLDHMRCHEGMLVCCDTGDSLCRVLGPGVWDREWSREDHVRNGSSNFALSLPAQANTTDGCNTSYQQLQQQPAEANTSTAFSAPWRIDRRTLGKDIAPSLTVAGLVPADLHGQCIRWGARPFHLSRHRQT